MTGKVSATSLYDKLPGQIYSHELLSHSRNLENEAQINNRNYGQLENMDWALDWTLEWTLLMEVNI